jgi:REP element-mobilizing transposase RayT
MTLYKNKYRIESTRLKGWDYSNDAAYFITICVYNMINYFGKVIENKVNLSNIGEIVNKEWLKTEVIRKNIVLDEYVIMPNHIHGIIMIFNEKYDGKVETHRVRLRNSRNNCVKERDARRTSLPNIIKGFKSACTNTIRESGYTNFKWQARFHDHIIRNEKELFYIRQYILNNPIKWTFDKYYRD